MNDRERRDIGRRVIAKRNERGWSKEKLAEEAAITTTTLRRIEAGLRTQEAKLHSTLHALGLVVGDGLTPDKYTEEQIHPAVFVLPPEIERGYENTVRFTQAVSSHVPELAERATKLMIAAAGLFADAGDALLRKGGDGNADAAGRGSAPIGAELSEEPTKDDFALAADEQGEIAGEQESRNET